MSLLWLVRLFRNKLINKFQMVNTYSPNRTVSSLNTLRKVGVLRTAMDSTRTDVPLWNSTFVSSFTWTVRSFCEMKPPDTITICSCGSTRLQGRPETRHPNWRVWPSKRTWGTTTTTPRISRKITCHRTYVVRSHYVPLRPLIDPIDYYLKRKLGPSILLRLASYKNLLMLMCSGMISL